jgi:hypothetical protein
VLDSNTLADLTENRDALAELLAGGPGMVTSIDQEALSEQISRGLGRSRQAL